MSNTPFLKEYIERRSTILKLELAARAKLLCYFPEDKNHESQIRIKKKRRVVWFAKYSTLHEFIDKLTLAQDRLLKLREVDPRIKAVRVHTKRKVYVIHVRDDKQLEEVKNVVDAALILTGDDAVITYQRW